MSYRYIDANKIKDMLFDDNDYIIEFCEAGLKSFKEFMESYRCNLLNCDMKELRKAGHKIRPGALMMGAEEVVEEYENAKNLMEQEADQSALVESVNKMNEICTTIQNELSHLAQDHR